MSGSDNEVYNSPMHKQTPLLYSEPLTQAFGTANKVYLKCDNLQPSGSFKIRGIGRTCQVAQKSRVQKIVGSSGGNAGMAMAYAAMKLGMDADIYIPTSTPAFMKDRIESYYGARVLVGGKTYSEATKRATKRQLLEKDTSTFVHSYDQSTSWDGNSTLVDEVREQLKNEYDETSPPAAFVVSVGGGGLAIGILLGIRRNGWEKDTALIAMETEGADAFNKSLLAEEKVELPNVSSIATSIGTSSCSTKLLDMYKSSGISIAPNVLQDSHAVRACTRFVDHHRMLVEPATGVSLAAVYFKDKVDWSVVKGDGPIIVEVCGGNVITLDLLQTFQGMFSV